MQKGKRFKLIYPAILVGFFLIFYSLHVSLPSKNSPIQFYSTSQRDDLKWVLQKALQKAKHSIHLSTYALTDSSILCLLKKKAQRGVDVHLYYHQQNTPTLHQLEAPHFTFHPIQEKGLMHEKIWIIDESWVFLGSANLTYSSLKMHDNSLLGFYSPPLAEVLLRSRPEDFSIDIGGKKLRYFSLPSRKALPHLLETLDQAKKCVVLSLFTFTHPLIVEKLITLHERGIQIILNIDSYTARGASQKALTPLAEAGIQATLSKGPQLFHHKWALIDNTTLILGSANWTQAAFSKNRDFIIFLN